MEKMTAEEVVAQERLVSEAARALDFFSEDELEAYASQQRMRDETVV